MFFAKEIDDESWIEYLEKKFGVQNWKGRLCLIVSWPREHDGYFLLSPFQAVDHCHTSSDTRRYTVGVLYAASRLDSQHRGTDT